MMVLSELIKLLNSSLYQDLPVETRLVVAKDYLIPYILKYIYGHKDYRKLVFYGGTCLRVVYGLPRLSEDIDTDNKADIDLGSFGEDLRKYMSGLLSREVNVYEQTGEGGLSRFVIKMPILNEIGLSPHISEKLHLKVEVSSHNQTYNREITTVNRGGQIMTIAHFDKPSLMAGKMIACMERVFRKGVTKELVKGRDWFDLWWYMNENVSPNEEKLRTDSEGKVGAKEAWELVFERLAKLKRRDLEMDLIPFFTDQVFINDWLDNFHDYFSRLRKSV
jgi:predicted nucleotidyltransferase component of viral defense system